MPSNVSDEYARVNQTYQKCLSMAAHKNTPTHERESAQNRAEELRKKLLELAPGAYKDLVNEGRILIMKHAEANWILGELASKVEVKYGQGKLQQYADDIGVDYGIMKHCRTTYSRWPQKAARPAFWIACALNPIKDDETRFQIAKRPGLTKRQAQAATANWKDEHKKKREAIKKKKEAEKKSKANGQDKKPPPEPPAIRREAEALVEIFNSLLEKDGNVQVRISKLKPEEEERKLILTALWDLHQRVETAINKFTKDKE